MSDIIKVTLLRDTNEPDQQWGFDLSEENGQLFFSEIYPGSLAERLGLLKRDVLLQINQTSVEGLSDVEVDKIMEICGNSFDMLIKRSNQVKINDSTPVEDSGSSAINVVDDAIKNNKRIGIHDVDGSREWKDWNTPWVRRDGRGLKNVLKSTFVGDGLSQTEVPIRTSHFHFYSQPHSLLEPVIGKPTESPAFDLDVMDNQANVINSFKGASSSPGLNPVNSDSEQMQVISRGEMENTTRMELVQNHCEDEDEANIPALEAISTKPLMMVNDSSSMETSFNDKSCIKNHEESKAMHEPSADELIDILKSLENIAACNPHLYRSIVKQIRDHDDNQFHYDIETFDESGNVNIKRGSLETDCFLKPIISESYKEQALPIEDHINVDQENHSLMLEQWNHDDTLGCYQEKEEDEHELCLYTEAKNNDEIDIQETKFVLPTTTKTEPTFVSQTQTIEPSPSKELKKIVVMAGSKHQSNWPIAPCVDPQSSPKTIEIFAGAGETDKELLENRKRVAEEAGLKHIEQSFYPEPTKQCNYPWTGSLKPVSNKLLQRDHKNKRGSEELYGNAPWMGSLKHVKNNKKIANAFKDKPLWQSKRYPDEDVPNPYESIQGKLAKPAYPLTPAAINIHNASFMEESANLKDDEEIETLRSNLRSQAKGFTNNLLMNLVPKFLKEHKSKVEPLGEGVSQKIMEDVRAMQMGINVDLSCDHDHQALNT